MLGRRAWKEEEERKDWREVRGGEMREWGKREREERDRECGREKMRTGEMRGWEGRRVERQGKYEKACRKEDWQ